MTILEKITTAGAASALAFGMAMSANAAVIVTGSDDDSDTTLSEGNDIDLDNDDIVESGQLVTEDNTGTFSVADNIISADGFADVRFSDGSVAGIRNLVITFTVAGLADQSFQVTNAAGVQFADSRFMLELLPSVDVSFVVTGEAFSTRGQIANYNFTLIGNAMEGGDVVPLPAAGLLFLTALGGAGFARSRKKA